MFRSANNFDHWLPWTQLSIIFLFAQIDLTWMQQLYWELKVTFWNANKMWVILQVTWPLYSHFIGYMLYISFSKSLYEKSIIF